MSDEAARAHPVSLALSASQGPCSAALRLATGEVLETPATDASTLAVAVRTLFAKAGLAPEDLEELRVDLGPGSYTGLRVALTFARTLQTFTSVPTLVVTSLELAALVGWTEIGIDPAHTVRPVLDARRGKLHYAALQLDRTITTIEPPRADSLQSLAAALRSGDVILADDALHVLLQPLVQARGASLRSSGTYCGRHLFHAALALRATEPAGLEPLYLMSSYAD